MWSIFRAVDSVRRGAARKAWMAAFVLGTPDGLVRSPTAPPAIVVDIGGVTALRAAPGGIVPLSKASVSPVSSSPVGSGEILKRLFCLEAERVGPSRGRHGRVMGV